MKANQLLKGLAKVAPTVGITVNRTVDRHYEWDGDGPDPIEEGYLPYDIVVVATMIVDGKTLHGQDSLGGNYEKPGRHDPEVSGYFHQMLVAALEDLRLNLEFESMLIRLTKWVGSET